MKMVVLSQVLHKLELGIMTRILKGKKFIVQGYGNVGYWASHFLNNDGAILIATQDAHATLINEKGISVADLHEHSKPRKGSVKGFEGASEMEPEDFFGLECDFIIPAALGNQITEKNASKIKSKVIAEGANGPTTAEADSILNEKGILVVPDILANAGGVTVSYFEWVQNRLGYYWTEERVNRRADRAMKQAFDNVYATAEKYGVNMRIAAYIVALDKVASTLKLRGSF